MQSGSSSCAVELGSRWQRPWCGSVGELQRWWLGGGRCVLAWLQVPAALIGHSSRAIHDACSRSLCSCCCLGVVLERTGCECERVWKSTVGHVAVPTGQRIPTMLTVHSCCSAFHFCLHPMVLAFIPWSWPYHVPVTIPHASTLPLPGTVFCLMQPQPACSCQQWWRILGCVCVSGGPVWWPMRNSISTRAATGCCLCEGASDRGVQPLLHENTAAESSPAA